ncbi:hypothetical protein L1280_002759 [Deinococcus sp. HSC-46F16]|uniref:hypothetical protein n=1 Tax=Deinococcus sp. HSC-46F16 TaxID=2910968 RepID=UPI00209F63FB|nr:hypothetical protein [Deinococcus sp. HSC-46F16]MCP2015591.1 hypothetical protein [Deinococcus sp. HSC-46F16]
MKRCLALAGWLTLLSPAHAEVLRWGTLTVTVTPRAEGNIEGEARAVVRNGNRTVLTVSGWNVAAELQPLRPGGLPELVLSTFSGGAHCCSAYYAFTQDAGRVENLAIIDGGNYGLRFVDLNRDGTKELLFASDRLAYYDWPYAVSPALLTVLAWDGVRLADRTHAYTYVPAQEAARNLGDLLAGLGKNADLTNLKARLGGYYANMILAGQGAQAEEVLRARVFAKSSALRDWFRQHRSGLIDATYAPAEGRMRVAERTTYPLKEPEQP